MAFSGSMFADVRSMEVRSSQPAASSNVDVLPRRESLLFVRYGHSQGPSTRCGLDEWVQVFTHIVSGLDECRSRFLLEIQGSRRGLAQSRIRFILN